MNEEAPPNTVQLCGMFICILAHVSCFVPSATTNKQKKNKKTEETRMSSLKSHGDPRKTRPEVCDPHKPNGQHKKTGCTHIASAICTVFMW